MITGNYAKERLKRRWPNYFRLLSKLPNFTGPLFQELRTFRAVPDCRRGADGPEY